MYTSIYNPYVPQEVSLAHHGIMGQHWGKRNGPPYPLSATVKKTIGKAIKERKALRSSSEYGEYKKAKRNLKLAKKDYQGSKSKLNASKMATKDAITERNEARNSGDKDHYKKAKRSLKEEKLNKIGDIKQYKAAKMKLSDARADYIQAKGKLKAKKAMIKLSSKNSELYHHGIMGQRWGKKNGPPYPLSAGAHSASEKKAGWRKSLAGGVKAVGRGTVKVAKAVGKGTVSTAKFVNKVAVRTHIKPRILMSEKEMTDSIARMRLSKQYKRALKGKFIDVTEAERNKGKGAISQLMGAIGKDVIIPTTTGLLRYAVAEKLGGKAEGEKVTSLKETLFNSKGGIGFRNDYFYDKNGNPVYREKGKKNGNGEKKEQKNGNGEGKQEKKKKPEQTSNLETKENVKPVSFYSNPVSESKPSPSLTRTQQLNARDVLGPVNTRKNASTIISNANQAFNKSWKSGAGYTASNNLPSHLSAKVGALNDWVSSYQGKKADDIFKSMKDGTWSYNDNETRKFRYGR